MKHGWKWEPGSGRVAGAMPWLSGQGGMVGGASRLQGWAQCMECCKIFFSSSSSSISIVGWGVINDSLDAEILH